MAKFLKVEMLVPLTESQATVLQDVSDFSKEEWHGIVGDAIRRSYLSESPNSIQIVGTGIVDDNPGFVLPEILP